MSSMLQPALSNVIYYLNGYFEDPLILFGGQIMTNRSVWDRAILLVEFILRSCDSKRRKRRGGCGLGNRGERRERRENIERGRI